MASSASNENRMTRLKQTMRTIYNTKDRSDVVFVVHGRDILAHQLIVANRSPVLKAMIEGPLAPSDQRHIIEDPEITYEDFENFLSFLYTDKCDFQSTKAKALLHMGNFFDVPFLLDRCVKKMNVLSRGVDSLWEYADMGLRYAPNSTMVQKCFGVLDSTLRWDDSLCFHTVEDELKWISAGLVMEFVKEFPRSVIITEDDVFKMVLEWSNNECLRRAQEITTDNVRAIMMPFMPHFDVTKLLPLTIATTIKIFELLPDARLIDNLADLVVKSLEESENSSRLRRNNGYGVQIDPDRYIFSSSVNRSGYARGGYYGRGGFGAAAARGGNRGNQNASGRGSYYVPMGRGGYGGRGRYADDHPRGGGFVVAGAGRGRGGGGIHRDESYENLWM